MLCVEAVFAAGANSLQSFEPCALQPEARVETDRSKGGSAATLATQKKKPAHANQPETGR